jgi:hypothetical protein
LAVAHLIADRGVVMLFGEPQRGWWVAPICILSGFGLLIVTNQGARAWIRWIGTSIRSNEPSQDVRT